MELAICQRVCVCVCGVFHHDLMGARSNRSITTSVPVFWLRAADEGGERERVTSDL